MGNTHRETESMRSVPEPATDFPVDTVLIASTHRVVTVKSAPQAVFLTPALGNTAFYDQ
jgi:hypothetical protein